MKKSKLNSLIINPINLQLFAEDKNDNNDSDNQTGVVDQNEVDYDGSYDSEENYYDEDSSADVEEREEENEEGKGDNEEEGSEQENTNAYDNDKSKQTKEENEQFKKMRQKAKADVLKEFESERAKLNEERKEIEAFRKQQREKQIEESYLREITSELVSDVAYREGISEDLARRLLTQEAMNNAQREINSIDAKMNQARIQKLELKDKPYYKELEQDIDNLMMRDPNVDAKTAYTYLRGLKLEELMANDRKNTEKRTIANIQDKARRRSIPSGSGSDAGLDARKVLSNDDFEMSIAFGNDPRKIAKRVNEKLKDKRR